ncbi:MAG: endonuclease III [Anaerolineaceae bacterium]|nr:endonuclease III [Anaerolineaceae bacterium]
MTLKPIEISPTQKDVDKAGKIYRILTSIYGMPKWREPLSAIDELISTILSQNTTDSNRDRAYHNLRAKFPTWESVMNAPAEKVTRAVRVAGLANQKGPRIQSVLRQIIAERGSLSLDFLRDMEKGEALNWLKKNKGVGPKTAAIVLQFSLGIPAFPVDTHVYRVTGRTGIRPDKLNVEQTHTWMEQLFDPKQYGAGHLNIIQFGREICHARKPECSICPISHLCNYFKNLP